MNDAASAPVRGGVPKSSSVTLAARKLCTGSGLIASSGSGFKLKQHVHGLVFGGMDGILTTFAMLAAVAGTQTSNKLILVIGISTVRSL